MSRQGWLSTAQNAGRWGKAPAGHRKPASRSLQPGSVREALIKVGTSTGFWKLIPTYLTLIIMT